MRNRIFDHTGEFVGGNDDRPTQTQIKLRYNPENGILSIELSEETKSIGMSVAGALQFSHALMGLCIQIISEPPDDCEPAGPGILGV